LRDEKADRVIDFAGPTEECFAPREFDNLFHRAISGLCAAVCDQAVNGLLVNRIARNLL
jgi:hypothetical protein